MDNCMPFPNLLVRVRRCRHCILHYMDENWEEQEMHMDDDMSELIQHEYDHLEGIMYVDIMEGELEDVPEEEE